MLTLTPSSSALSRSSRVTRSTYRNALFDRVFSAPPIYDTLFDCCIGTVTIACLSWVRRSARLAFLDYFTSTWHKLLLRFVSDPLVFRSLQARIGFLVSGSLPLQVFLGTDFSSDIDLYPWPGTERELGNCLIEQGYQLQLAGWGEYKSFSDIMDKVEQHGWRSAVASAPIGLMDAYRGCANVAGILCFTKRDGSGDHALQIHLVASDTSPVITILGFHSTVVLNIISWDCALCLFPGLTIKERAMCALRENATPNSEVMTKYKSRGFAELFTLPADTTAATLAAAETTQSRRRWVGDKSTWIVGLLTADVEPPEQTQVDITLYGFTISQRKAASLAELDSDIDSPVSLVDVSIDTNVQLRFDQETHFDEETRLDEEAPRAEERPYTVPYSVPEDFKVTLKILWETAKQFKCSCRDLYFNLRDATGRDGELRKRKLAYERHHDGLLGPLQQNLHHLQHCIQSTRSPYAKRQTKRRKLSKQD